MIDIKILREKKDWLKKKVADKGFDTGLVDKAYDLDEERRKLMAEVQLLQAERNKAAKEKNIEEGKKIKIKLQKVEPKLNDAENSFNEVFFQIPNPALDDVLVGKGEKENIEVKKWGEPRKFDFEPKDHLELGKNLGILDFETGAKVTGSQFYYLYGDGALLELSLVMYVMELLQKEGFTPVITPDLAKSRFYLGTGYAPKGDEAQTYVIEGGDLGLIATAEVTLAGKHADEVIPEKELPLKYVGYSHCFRQEAGAYGKYSKGLYRVHEFSKAEMFIYCLPEESEKMHEQILAMEEKIYQELGLPYRIIEMCTGDLGAMAARKFDYEAWMPDRNDYGEISSASNCTDYQSRNLNIKVKRNNGKTEYLHMLNGTAIVMTRIPLAILENYQQKDGSVVIPEVLRKWMGKDKITPRV